MRIGILFATIVALCAFSTIAAAAQDTSWKADPAAVKDWFDPANWTNGIPSDDTLTAYVDNGGTARISAGSATSPDVWIGHDNSGRLILDAGSLDIRYGLLLGAAPNSHGTVEINGGSLKSQSFDIGANLGLGNVIQTGGSADALYVVLGGSSYWPYFSIDGQPGDFGTGEYQLVGGRLNATQLAVGNAGSGTFRQLGGVASVDTLKVGGAPTFIIIGPGITPFFPALTPTDMGVTNSSAAIASWLVPPSLLGLYELSGGILSTRDLIIDHTGTFRQTGGTQQTNYADIRSDGRYELLGGSLQIATGLNVDGTFDFGHSSSTISAGSAILNFSQGLADAEHAHIAVGPDSLTIFPAGFRPGRDLGSYESQGITHVAGTDLLVRAGKTIRGAGHIDDFVIAAGTIAASNIAAADRGLITLNDGIELRPGAQVDLGFGSVYVKDLRTTIRGGNLTASTLDVAGTVQFPSPARSPGPGAVIEVNWPIVSPGAAHQTGGSVDLQMLSVEHGAYALSGGRVKTGSLYIGPEPQTIWPPGSTATFSQSGGEVEAWNVEINPEFFYIYTAATNAAAAGSAQNFSGASANSVPRRPRSISASTYIMSGGSLETSNLSLYGLADGTQARFVQTGGQVIATGAISLNGATSSYTLLGGSLHARSFSMGYMYPFAEFPPEATLSLLNKSADIEISGYLSLGDRSHFDAVPGTTIRLTHGGPTAYYWPNTSAGSVAIGSTNSDDLAGLHNLKLIFEGGLDDTATLEAAGKDLGDVASGYFHNFALDTLQIGGIDPAKVSLVDLVDNQLNGDANEAVYVEHLIVRPGSILDLGGIHLYYHTADIAAGATLNGFLSAVGAIPEPGTAALAWLAIYLAAFSTNRRRPS